MDFKLNPTNYLGHENEVFKSSLMELALSNPKQYFELRKDILEAVKKQAVDDCYNTYYYLLTEGKEKKGATALLNGKTSDGYISFIPKIPMQKVNEFALKAAKTLDSIAEEAIEMILPQDYRDLAENRAVQKTSGTLGFS